MTKYVSEKQVGDLATAMGGAVALLRTDQSEIGKTAASASRAAGLTPMDFGAVGEGGDDTAGMTAALQTGGRISGGGRTFKINSNAPINIASGLELTDCTLDFSGATLASGQAALRAVAALEASRTMTADAVAGSNTVACDSTGLVPGDVLLIQSARVWSNDGADTVTAGETVVVATVSSGSVAVYPALSDSYTLADSATVRRIGGIKGVRLRRVRLIGPGETTLTYGAYFARGVDIKLEQCKVEKFGAAGAAFENCYDFEATNGTFSEAYGSGLGYGIVCLSACRSYRITGNLFQRGRTGWTQGGTTGVGRDIVVANNNFVGQFTGAINTKNAADGITITGNTCVGDGGQTGLQDGIRIRGRNAVVQGNIVTGYSRYSIYMALYGQSSPASLKTCVVANNTVKAAKDVAIYVDNLADGDAGNIAITGNNVDHAPGVASASKGAIHVRSTGAMKNVNITGNNVADSPFNCVDVRPVSSGTIANLNVTGNVLERSAAAIAAEPPRQPVVTTGVTNATTTPNITV